MGMGNSFETITVLQYRLKEAQEELAAFQSGEKYIRMEKQEDNRDLIRLLFFHTFFSN